ncbi:MAG: HAD-IIA family hydrolase [Lentisphaeria bacterium]|nr:HAD-IIA family hydrolase [Lentisphaeria bacterium]
MDMDGTIYRGRTLFPWTLPWLEFLRRHRIGFTFLTNNSSRSRSLYVERLDAMGIRITPEQMYTSTWNAIDYLRETYPGITRLFILGTPSMRREMREAGFQHVDDDPDLVLVAFDTGLTYEHLCRTAYWISRGKPFLATHPDLICPTDEQTLLVDCGSICACLSAATLRRPDKVLGKPNPEMLCHVARNHGLTPADLLMVGDRLQTDMLLAARAGALSCKVANPREDGIYNRDIHLVPDLTVEHLGELHARMEEALGPPPPASTPDADSRPGGRSAR